MRTFLLASIAVLLAPPGCTETTCTGPGCLPDTGAGDADMDAAAADAPPAMDSTPPADAPAIDAVARDGASSCTSDTECNDGNACTTDRCRMRSCAHEPCGAGTVCAPSGCAACGGPDEPCCADSTCDMGLWCNGTVCTCGQAGHVCCPWMGGTCESAATCGLDGTCCVVQFGSCAGGRGPCCADYVCDGFVCDRP